MTPPLLFSLSSLSSSSMASIVCSAATLKSAGSPSKPSISISSLHNKSNLPLPTLITPDVSSRFQSLRVNAAESSANKGTKPKSIVCADCDGNGAKICTQCKGSGVNSVDHFNGQFKAGAVCWLCRGKKEILCGNCNGAGFVGGFMSALDETPM